MIFREGLKVSVWSIISFSLFGLLLGCGSVLQEQKKETSTGMSVSQPQSSKKLDRPDARYYDFEDIQIPNELKLDRRKSRVFQSPNLMAGVLVLDGYIEMKSLNNFFKDAMVKDNWQAKGNFQLSPKTVLLFEKKNKRCVMFFEETIFNTYVEIWVIPTQDGQ
jgi:hypothetical protein